MTPIFIPTYGRSEVKTLHSLPIQLAKRVALVVSPGTRLGNVAHLDCPIQGSGIHNVREWLRGYARSQRIPCLIMLDDDLKLTTAVWEDGKKRFKSDPQRLSMEFQDTESRCLTPGVAFASFSQTYFNLEPRRWAQNKDNAGTYFVNVEEAYRSGLTFDLPSVDDRRFILGAIENGKEVWANTNVGATKIGEHGRGGEATVGERGARHEASLRLLARRYPRFVKLRTSSNPAYQQNYGTDLTATFYLSHMWKAVQRGEQVRGVAEG